MLESSFEFQTTLLQHFVVFNLFGDIDLTAVHKIRLKKAFIAMCVITHYFSYPFDVIQRNESLLLTSIRELLISIFDCDNFSMKNLFSSYDIDFFYFSIIHKVCRQ